MFGDSENVTYLGVHWNNKCKRVCYSIYKITSAVCWKFQSLLNKFYVKAQCIRKIDKSISLLRFIQALFSIFPTVYSLLNGTFNKILKYIFWWCIFSQLCFVIKKTLFYNELDKNDHFKLSVHQIITNHILKCKKTQKNIQLFIQRYTKW